MTTHSDPMTTIISEIDNISETDAIHLWHTLRDRFGWTGTFFTRSDAEDMWIRLLPLHPGEPEPVAGDMPDDFWDRLSSGRWWNRTIPETLTERGWDLIADAVEEDGF